MLTNLLFWIVFGIISGSIANMIDPRSSKGGILGSMILGIVGAIVGGWLGNMLFGVGVDGFNLPSFIVSIAGALLVLFISRALTRSV